MRVLFFNYEYPPLGGGAAHASHYLLEEFSKKIDLKVDFITSSVDKDYHLERRGENVFIHKLPVGKNNENLHFQSQKDLLVYAWKACWFSLKLLKREKYDLSLAFFTVPCGFVSLILKISYKIPYIISLRGSDVPGYSERFSFLYNFLKPLIKLIWKKSGAVVANSEGLKDLALRSKPGQKIEVIYNGIQVEKFCPNETLRNKNEFIITLGGTRVTSRKGIRYLIEAVKILAPKYPRIKLKIVGDGDEREVLEKMTAKFNLSDKISFVGRVDEHDRMISFYQEASIFVLPSLNEGMSNAMLEALSSGLPIITTDTGGAKELVKNGENGFIIKMKSSQDIAEKLEKLILDENLRKKMGEKSRERALGMSWKKVAEKYEEIFEKIINNRKDSETNSG